MFNPIAISTRVAASRLFREATGQRPADGKCRKKGAVVMRLNLAVKVCVWPAVVLLAAGSGWAQETSWRSRRAGTTVSA